MPIMDERLEKRLAAGEVVLGGCIILGNDPEQSLQRVRARVASQSAGEVRMRRVA